MGKDTKRECLEMMYLFYETECADSVSFVRSFINSEQSKLKFFEGINAHNKREVINKDLSDEKISQQTFFFNLREVLVKNYSEQLAVASLFLDDENFTEIYRLINFAGWKFYRDEEYVDDFEDSSEGVSVQSALDNMYVTEMRGLFRTEIKKIVLSTVPKELVKDDN